MERLDWRLAVSTAGAAVLVSVLVFFLVSCQTVKKDTYKVLATSAEAYNLVMETASEAHKAGKISDEKWDRIKDVALDFFNTYQKAVEVLLRYSEGNASDDDVGGSITKMTGLLQKLSSMAGGD